MEMILEISTLGEKWLLSKMARLKTEELEKLVAERTADLINETKKEKKCRPW